MAEINGNGNGKFNGNLRDRRVKTYNPLITPSELFDILRPTPETIVTVKSSRRQLEAIMDRIDSRIVIEVGPCSAHDVDEALEYASPLKELSDHVQDKFFIIIREYVEKPRSSEGWAGLIDDPYMDKSCNMNEGLLMARRLFLEISKIGLPIVTEFLHEFTPQYLDDLTTHAVIGARTSEYSYLRKMLSALSMPAGIKNNTEGLVSTAIDGVIVARNPQAFVGVGRDGRISKVETAGNPYAHIILRGGRNGPNYDAENVADALNALETSGLPRKLAIDCSHANSGKDHEKQILVFEDIIRQIRDGQTGIFSVMLESYLDAGAQSVPYPLPSEFIVKPRLSITDKCMSWETTERIILDAYRSLK